MTTNTKEELAKIDKYVRKYAKTYDLLGRYDQGEKLKVDPGRLEPFLELLHHRGEKK